MTNQEQKIVFLRELAELLKKHNATIQLEIVSEADYSSHTELGFKVDGKYLNDVFSTNGTFNSIGAEDIYNRL